MEINDIIVVFYRQFNKMSAQYFKTYSIILLVVYLITIIALDINEFLFEAIMDLIFLIGFSIYLYVIYTKIKVSSNENHKAFKLSFLITILVLSVCFIAIITKSYDNKFVNILSVISILSFIIHFLIIIIEVQRYLKDKSVFFYLIVFVFFPLSLPYSFKIMNSKN